MSSLCKRNTSFSSRLWSVQGYKTKTNKAHSESTSAQLCFSRTRLVFYQFWQKLHRNTAVFILVWRWALYHHPSAGASIFHVTDAFEMSFACSEFWPSFPQGQRLIPDSGFPFLFIHQSHLSLTLSQKQDAMNDKRLKLPPTARLEGMLSDRKFWRDKTNWKKCLSSSLKHLKRPDQPGLAHPNTRRFGRSGPAVVVLVWF